MVMINKVFLKGGIKELIILRENEKHQDFKTFRFQPEVLLLGRIKKRGSDSKTIGIVYMCETGHTWSFLRAAKTMTS